jgi:transposase
MKKQHDQKFKKDAVAYYNAHKDLGVKGCATNRGIGYSTLQKWLKQFKETGSIPTRLQPR